MKKLPRSTELRSAIRAIEKADLAGFEVGDIVEVIRQREKSREARKREVEDVYLDVVLERMHRREREVAEGLRRVLPALVRDDA